MNKETLTDLAKFSELNGLTNVPFIEVWKLYKKSKETN